MTSQSVSNHLSLVFAADHCASISGSSLFSFLHFCGGDDLRLNICLERDVEPSKR